MSNKSQAAAEIQPTEWMTLEEITNAGFLPNTKSDIETAVSQFSLDRQVQITKLLWGKENNVNKSAQKYSKLSQSAIMLIREYLINQNDTCNRLVSRSAVSMMEQEGYLCRREPLGEKAWATKGVTERPRDRTR